MNSIDSFGEIKRDIKKISIKISNKNNNVEISVEDNGCGISQENKEKIFKINESHKKIDGRMGIGLYSSKKIAKEDLGGDLIFESKEGVGTVFKLIIPYEN